MVRAPLTGTVALGAFALCLLVVVLGAYVRLSAAGLGCPDWPGCYGHLTPSAAAEAPPSGPYAGQPVQVGKAWREMIHRYAAGTLAVLIGVLAVLAFRRRRERLVNLPLVVTLLLIVLAQAILGMLTVTRRLQPLVVTLHLLGGLTTLAILWWLVLTLWRRRRGAWGTGTWYVGRMLARTQQLALVALALLALQITLGGWTSSNYAATACPDLPTCQGAWWPAADYRGAFVPTAGANRNAEGGVLSQEARVAVHVAHRLGAVALSLVLVLTTLAVLRRRSDPLALQAAVAVLVLLGLQLLIGVLMVHFGFPLWLATAHNAGAALLLLALVALNRALRPA